MVSLSKSYSEAKTITIMLSIHILILLGLSLRNSILLRLSVTSITFWFLTTLVFSFYLATSLINPGYWPLPNTSLKPPQGTFVILVEENIPSNQANIATIKDENTHLEIISDKARSNLVPSIKNETEEKDQDKDQDKGIEKLNKKDNAQFCIFCKLYQPYRTKHCRDCKKCVSLYDHHCPWIGGCVGQNNRIYFFWYVFFQCIQLWWAGFYVILI